MMRIRLCLISAALFAACLGASAQQVPNMNFDQWSKKGGCWNPWAKDSQNPAWDTANHGLSLLGVNGASPEYEHVAVKGPGKAAAKLETRQVLGILAGGSIFTGKFLKVVRMSGAKMSFGVPFTGRPKSLSGYIHYIPGKIDVASKELSGLKGATDNATIEISLKDSGPLVLDTTDENFSRHDGAGAPNTVGYGVKHFKEETKGYIRFEIPIEYRSGHTPTHIVIVATSSRYAQQFTGSTDSVMYLDELQLNY